MMLSPADLLRMNPFALMRRMTEEMDRVLGEVASGRRGNGPMVWAPAIEVEKRGDNCVIRAELPGLKPEDVKLEVTDGAIIIEGERKEEQEENREGARMSERRYGYFYRSIPLPEGADPEKARAKFENGMLEIAVPVQKQEEQRRRIPIESAEKAEKANRAA
nr:Hsp20/alpha crystallin family [uncultured bacterium]